MKRLKIFAGFTLVTLLFAGSLMAYGPRNGMGMGAGTGAPLCISDQFPAQPISAEERAGLLKMREEEKLARDVYLALYEKWNHRTFSNIAGAEQRHMDAVKCLLDKYGITDPVIDNTPGVFSDPNVRNLYQALVTKGLTSLENALWVGATIEDMDIYDLNTLLSQTDNDDIQNVYTSLNNGSKNHLRAYCGVLSTFGIVYEAQYLTQNEIEEIISTPWK